MTLVLLIVLILLLGGGWVGNRSYGVGLESPIGIILLIAVLAVVCGLLVPHTGWYRY